MGGEVPVEFRLHQDGRKLQNYHVAKILIAGQTRRTRPPHPTPNILIEVFVQIKGALFSVCVESNQTVKGRFIKENRGIHYILQKKNP